MFLQYDISNITKHFLFQINAFLLNFLFIKKSWKKYHRFLNKIKQHDCF